MFAFFAGLAAGLLHVFSGPDHLAAVAPLAADEIAQRADDLESKARRSAMGLGHTAGVLLIATLLLLPRRAAAARCHLRLQRTHRRRVADRGRRLGRRGQAQRTVPSVTPHSHAGASFVMGTIHGLAGSSHLFGVLPALAFSTRVDRCSTSPALASARLPACRRLPRAWACSSVRLGGDHRRYRACSTPLRPPRSWSADSGWSGVEATLPRQLLAFSRPSS